MATLPTIIDTARATMAPASLAFCLDGGRSGWIIATAEPAVFVALDWASDDAGRVVALIRTFDGSARIVPMPGSYFQLSQYVEDWSQDDAAILPGFLGLVGDRIFLRAWEWSGNRHEPRWVDLATGEVVADSLDVSIVCRVWSLKVPVGLEDAVLYSFGGR